MQDIKIDPRTLLRRLLDECKDCKKRFDDNAALLVANDEEVLTEDQVEAILIDLSDDHRKHGEE